MTRLNHLTAVNVLLFSLGIWVLPAAAADPPDVPHQASPVLPTWAQVRSVPMRGDFKAFWNVGGGDVEYNNREAVAHGFRLVILLNTYADYPGNQKENIANAQRGNRTNPWKKPDYFERIIRRNTAQARRDGEILVHDIEFDFAEDIDKACRLAFNHPMGPFELADFSGLDTKLYVADALLQSFGDRFRSSQTLRNMVAARHHGRKTGKGWYDYNK